jgi:hypothetical protein
LRSCAEAGGLYRIDFDNQTISVQNYQFDGAQGAAAIEVATIFGKMWCCAAFLQEGGGI